MDVSPGEMGRTAILGGESLMIHRRALKGALVLVLGGAALVSACGRRKYSEVNDITPSVKVNRLRTPLGSPIEITYTWTLGPTAKKLGQDYRAFVHFLDSHRVVHERSIDLAELL